MKTNSLLALVLLASAATSTLAADSWIRKLLDVPYPPGQAREPAPVATLHLLRQDFETLEIDQSVIRTPLTIGSKHFQRGLGTHSTSQIHVSSPEPLARFQATVGLDLNERTTGGHGSIRFHIAAGGKTLFTSRVHRGGQEPETVDVDLAGAREVDLTVDDAGDGPGCDHADWAEARFVTRSGKTLWADALPQRSDTKITSNPFSFRYGDQHSDDLLKKWPREVTVVPREPGASLMTFTWNDPQTGLRVQWIITLWSDFDAGDWMLTFENRGTRDTPILADVKALDLAVPDPRPGASCYRLHRTNGAPANPTDFEPSEVELAPGSHVALGGSGGRSSQKDFPFVKIETARQSAILAIGWSGQWAMDLNCRDDRLLHVTAGQELTHFKLHPGEQVRTPRILLFPFEGDTLEANARFRQLISRHYAARRNGKVPQPTLFCNTCFTRGGGWLNECNADNQISLIRAYAPLGLEALITDAGWFEGGWPAGAGNWNPRRDAYPQGMGPVALAAQQHGMVYGLWFEFERVVASTSLAKEHPDWLLKSVDVPESTYLLNLGLPAVRQHMVATVKGFMDLPGFRFYRSDFNIDPLPFWRHSDPPDRQGITEMHYVAGLYDFWDRLAATWPDAFREECASGGRRFDLETVMRMHFHQESDYWFDNEVDLAVVWSLSRYLPNSVFTTPISRLDDRSFQSTMATSLIPGWIADAAGFDSSRARQLTSTYRRLRHLLVGGYYPLTPYSRDGKHPMALQFTRPELGEGLVLVVPPRGRSGGSVKLELHGLKPRDVYEVTAEVAGRHETRTGADLMSGFVATLPPGDGGERFVYRLTPGAATH